MKNIIKILCIIIALQCIVSCNTQQKSHNINGLYKIDSKENKYTEKDIYATTDPLLLLVDLSLDSNQLDSMPPNYLYINDSTLSLIGNKDEDGTIKYTSFAKNDSVINLIINIKGKDTITFYNGKNKSLFLHPLKLHLSKIAN